jgi:hypothetical protein
MSAITIIKVNLLLLYLTILFNIYTGFVQFVSSSTTIIYIIYTTIYATRCCTCPDTLIVSFAATLIPGH